MGKGMIFDTHAHYDDEAFDADREELLDGMAACGIGSIVNACASIKSLTTTPALARTYPFVYAAVGIHPDDAGQVTDEILEKIRELTDQEKVVAVGEIGLDYYWHKEEEEHRIQQKVFRSQMEIAREKGLPFIVHSRDAGQDTLDIVREYVQRGMTGGIIHCFSYGEELAREYIQMGLFLGIGGVVTYKNARKLPEVVSMTPLSQLVLETDCPYLSPVPERGKRNDSSKLPLVVRKIAEIKGVDEETVIRTTQENAEKLFSIKVLA